MANVDGTFYSGESQRPNTKPVSPPNAGDDPVYPINPPGTTNTTLYKLLGDVTDSDFIGKNGRVPVVNDENVLTLEPLPQLQENGLISGGIVQWTGIGYVFNVSGAFYRIAGVYYESPPIQITLATPDVTNNRIDVFAVDINGVALDITGTPSGSPVKPQIDPQTQLELTSVIVTASTTTPNLTEEVIYDENTEWTGSSIGTGTVAFNSVVDPFQGSVSIEATNIQNGLKIRLTDGSDYDLSTVQTLGLQINLKATMGAGINIGVTFLNSSGSPISTELILSHNKSLLGYQFVGIALSQFSFTSFLARSIEFRYIRTKGTIIYSGFFLDIIKLEGGINPPLGVSSFLALSDTPSAYSGQAGKTVAVKADESGLEFVTGGGGASTFLALTDTPSTYAGQANKWTRVNGGETALVFDTVSPYDLDQKGATDGQVVTWVAANSRYEPTTPSGGSISGLTTNKITKATSATTIGDSVITEFNTGSNGLIIGTNVGSPTATPLSVSFGGTYGTNAAGSAANLKWMLYRDGTVSNDYGIGMTGGLMEIRAGSGGGIGLFPNNGAEGIRILSSGNVGIGIVAPVHKLSVVGTFNATGNTTLGGTLDVTSNFSAGGTFVAGGSGRFGTNVGSPTATPLSVSFGGTFGTSAAGSSANLKWMLYNDGGTGANFYGIGMTGGLMEFRVGTGAGMGFFPNNGVESFRILNTGNLKFIDAKNFELGSTTGTKIGTATNQKLSFWNKTPIIQPTTAITGASLVGGGGTTITDTDTFGGYTIAKAIAAMINTGLLA